VSCIASFEDLLRDQLVDVAREIAAERKVKEV
jgi:hypothetical protein